MFTGFGDELIPFFLDIRFHNDRSFMDANRKRYESAVRQPFYDFIGEMAPTLLSINPDFELRPAKCLSRINRDTRFSKDKSPYRDHLWVAFRKAAVEKDSTPFYWFEISPEELGWGVGMWGENRPMFDAMRRRIVAQPDDFMKLLTLLQKRGFGADGEPWKKMPVPDGVPEALIPLYRSKTLFFPKKKTELSWILSSDIVRRVAEDYRAIAPIYHMLRGCADEAMEAADEKGGEA